MGLENSWMVACPWADAALCMAAALAGEVWHAVKTKKDAKSSVPVRRYRMVFMGGLITTVAMLHSSRENCKPNSMIGYYVAINP